MGQVHRDEITDGIALIIVVEPNRDFKSVFSQEFIEDDQWHPGLNGYNLVTGMECDDLVHLME